jgi:hypothetical protein
MRRYPRATLAVAGAMLGVMTGCRPYLAFGTATKFALDVSQRADQTIDVSMGYDRAEIASIPAPEANATDHTDTYAVLGTFSVKYGNPFDGEPLTLKQLFATGMAARIAASDADTREYFGARLREVEQKKQDAQKGPTK